MNEPHGVIGRLAMDLADKDEVWKAWVNNANFMNGEFAQQGLQGQWQVDSKDGDYITDAQGRVVPKKNRAARRAEARSQKQGRNGIKVTR